MAMTEEQYINKIYDAQKQSTLNTLKSAYDKNIASVDSAMSNLGTSAYEAKRQAAGEAALTRQRLNEQFAANGLNTGAAGQAHLALLNQQTANLNNIEAKRMQAENAYNAQKAALTQEYQSQIKSAILDNDADRAAALYALYKQNVSALYKQNVSGRGSGGGGSGGGRRDKGNGGFKDPDDNGTPESGSAVYRNGAYWVGNQRFADEARAEAYASYKNGSLSKSDYAKFINLYNGGTGKTSASYNLSQWALNPNASSLNERLGLMRRAQNDI